MSEHAPEIPVLPTFTFAPFTGADVRAGRSSALDAVPIATGMPTMTAPESIAQSHVLQPLAAPAITTLPMAQWPASVAPAPMATVPTASVGFQPAPIAPSGFAPLESYASINDFDPRSATGIARLAPVAIAVAVSFASLAAILWVVVGGGPSSTSAGSPAHDRAIAKTINNLHDDLVPSASVRDGWTREHAGLWTSRAGGSPVSVIVSSADVGQSLDNDELQRNARELVQQDLTDEHLSATIVSVERRDSTFGFDGGAVVRMHRTQSGADLNQDFYLATDGDGRIFTVVSTSIRGDSTGTRNATRFVEHLRPS